MSISKKIYRKFFRDLDFKLLNLNVDKNFIYEKQSHF